MVKTLRESMDEYNTVNELDFIRDMLKYDEGAIRSNSSPDYHREYNISGDIYDGDYYDAIMEALVSVGKILNKYNNK